MGTSAHLDRFVLDHLPSADQQPGFIFDLPELAYPDRLNAAAELLRRAVAAAGPDGRALIDFDHAFSWSRVDAISGRMAQVLVEDMGLVPGNRVLLHGPNSAWTVLAWFAILKAGGVVVATMPMLRAAELATVIDKGRISHALVYEAFADVVTEARVTAPSLTRVMDSAALQTAARALPAGFRFEPVQTAADDPALIAFTSGTTGLPKGVMHSDNTLLANGRMMVRDWHHDQHSILVALSPLSHHIGTVSIEQWLAAGLQLVIHNFAAGKPALDWIIESQGTYVMGVPTHAMDILEDVRRRGLTAMGKVTSFYMAGSPIPREVAEQFLRIGVTPQNVYGMTENGSHQYTLPTDPTSTIVATCGRAAQGYEVRIFDAEHPDHEVAQGQVGEIGGRGGVLMLGYFDDQTATENSFNRSGWFMSGDLGVFDEQGCLQIVGRKKDLIIRGGHNIHPARIEDLTHRHPDVVKAAVFPIADDRLGERVCLSILQRAGATIDPQQVLQHLHEVGLSKYDMPEYFIVMPAFPLTASGKILKRELIEMTKRGDIKPTPVRWKAPA